MISRRKLLLGITSAIAASTLDLNVDFARLSNGLDVLLSGALADDKKDSISSDANTTGNANDQTNTDASAVYLPNLKSYVDALQLFSNPEETQKFLAAYGPKQDYHALFANLAKQLANLDVVKYATEHTLEFKFKFGDVIFKVINDAITDPKINGTTYLSYRRSTNLMAYCKKREESNNKQRGHTLCEYDIYGVYYREYRINAKKGYVFSNEFEKTMYNHLFYVAHFLLQQAYSNASKLNDEWKQKPWREFVGTAHDDKKCYGEKPTSYDKMYGGYNPRTKELVFLGTSWCKPCKDIAFHLLKNKIRFREKENDVGQSSPLMWNGCYNLYGSEEIIQAINRMYAIIN